MHQANNKTGPVLPATTSSPTNPISVRVALKINEFGARYGMPRQTVYKLLKHGLPHFNLGPHNRIIPVAEADAWMVENYLVGQR